METLLVASRYPIGPAAVAEEVDAWLLFLDTHRMAPNGCLECMDHLNLGLAEGQLLVYAVDGSRVSASDVAHLGRALDDLLADMLGVWEECRFVGSGTVGAGFAEGVVEEHARSAKCARTYWLRSHYVSSQLRAVRYAT